jgi:trimeric autotransporter adhesin
MGLAASLGAETLAALGITAETAPAWLVPAIGGVEAGALGGGALSAIEGKPILPGVLGGGLTGGLTGGLGAEFGTAGAIGGGALGGAASSALQGQSPLTGALTGGALAGLTSALGGLGSAPTGAGGAAGASALPGAAADGPLDTTQALGVSPEVYGPPAAAVGGSDVGVPFGAPPSGEFKTFSLTSGPAAGVPGAEAPVSETFGPPLAGATPGEQAFSQAAGAAAAAPLGAPVTGAGDGTVPFSQILKDPMGVISTHPGAALGALGIGYQAIKGMGDLPGEGALKAQLAQLQGLSQQELTAAQTGALPPAERAIIDQALNANIANIRSQYARMGMSGSSAEQQAIANAQNTAASQGGAYLQQLLQQGTQTGQAAGQLANYLAALNAQQQADLGKSVASFSGALAGGKNV